MQIAQMMVDYYMEQHGIKEHWIELAKISRELQAAPSQETWLLQCLHYNRDTEYGRQYRFNTIATIEDYQKRIPLTDYQQLSGYMQRIANAETDVLFKGKAIAVELTGGSSGGAKLIPYSDRSIIDFRQGLLPWLGRVAAVMNKGPAYWAISPVVRDAGHTSGGIPIGMNDGAYLGQDVMILMNKVAAVPYCQVNGAQDMQTWQTLTLYYLLRQSDLELISVWSPTFMLLLLQGIEKNAELLCTVLKSGCEVGGQSLLADAPALQRLQQYLQQGDARILWPELRMLSCWAHASSARYYEQLRERFPYVQFQPKGLLATEALVTVPDADGTCVLAQGSGFYEFLSAGRCYLPHELTAGQSYEVVTTTSGGLYRYRNGDTVVCDGYKQGIPILRFAGRLGAVSDLVGEKLTDEFVVDCLHGILGFSMLVPSHESKPGYILILDAAQQQQIHNPAQWVEQCLAKNPQYAYARTLGQLHPLRIRKVSQPLQCYLDYESRRRSLGDIKMQALSTDTRWLQILVQDQVDVA